VHDVSFFGYPQDFRWLDRVRRQRLVAASIRASAAILACSEFTRGEIARFFPEAAPRVHHVPLGPDDDLPPAPERTAARARLGVQGPFVVTVGSVLNRRRLPELLQAMGRLHAQIPDVVLDVVGDNRTEPRQDLAAMVAGLGLRDAVRLSGFVSEEGLADRYAAADAAVFLSEYEGFGLPPLEAMTRGVPVITSTKPSLSEIFAPAAVLVEPRDVAAVADVLARVLTDAALRADLVARGRALAFRYSWAETARATMAVIEEAACRSR
jgi:glycosyltransferase involved in cell wall biosynthesis